jgi:hypothetical protein
MCISCDVLAINNGNGQKHGCMDLCGFMRERNQRERNQLDLLRIFMGDVKGRIMSAFKKILGWIRAILKEIDLKNSPFPRTAEI